MHASVNVGCQGETGPGKIHEVILALVGDLNCHLISIGDGGTSHFEKMVSKITLIRCHHVTTSNLRS